MGHFLFLHEIMVQVISLLSFPPVVIFASFKLFRLLLLQHVRFASEAKPSLQLVQQQVIHKPLAGRSSAVVPIAKPFNATFKAWALSDHDNDNRTDFL